jgi:hypothetical protein
MSLGSAGQTLPGLTAGTYTVAVKGPVPAGFAPLRASQTVVVEAGQQTAIARIGYHMVLFPYRALVIGVIFIIASAFTLILIIPRPFRTIARIDLGNQEIRLGNQGDRREKTEGIVILNGPDVRLKPVGDRGRQEIRDVEKLVKK